MKWVRQAHSGGAKKCVQNLFNKNLKEGDHLEDICIDGKVILIIRCGM
jgi:hypothetical protein